MAPKKKSKWAFPLGMLIIIFAIIGIVAVVIWTVSAAKALTDNSVKKQEYEEFLRPVVMYDPDPFDDVKNADVTQLVNAAIWSLITQSDSSEAFTYSTGDNMGILIPKSKVTEEFIKLFGKEIDIESEYGSIDMSPHDITYDTAQGGFIIPITSLDVAYTPEVLEIEKKASSIIITVAYIGTKAWAEVDGNAYAAPEADKYMKVTLRQGDAGYYIASLQSVSSSEVADVQPATAPQTASQPAVTSGQTVVSTVPAEENTDETTTGEDTTDEGEGEASDEEETTTAQAE